MPKITKGGVTDVNVDDEFVAPPGTPPADAIERGVDGQEQERQDSDAHQQQREKKNADENKGDGNAPVGISGHADAEVTRPAKKAPTSKQKNENG